MWEVNRVSEGDANQFDAALANHVKEGWSLVAEDSSTRDAAV